jgi:hypothetical protein
VRVARGEREADLGAERGADQVRPVDFQVIEQPDHLTGVARDVGGGSGESSWPRVAAHDSGKRAANAGTSWSHDDMSSCRR